MLIGVHTIWKLGSIIFGFGIGSASCVGTKHVGPSLCEVIAKYCLRTYLQEANN